MDPQTRTRIRVFLEQRVAVLTDPREIGDALEGELAGLWRYRVGDYRVICEIYDDQLRVLAVRIGHRRHIYR
jgi:mRNA interferase RelE/StbE